MTWVAKKIAHVLFAAKLQKHEKLETLLRNL